MLRLRHFFFSLLLAIQLAAGAKYGCVFDCYLFDPHGSAQGYIEFTCDNTTNTDCCSWKRCIQPTYTAYYERICPGSEVNTAEGGFGKYSVVDNDSPKAQFPRQTSTSFLQTGDFGDCSGVPTSQSVGCTGNCAGHAVRVEVSAARGY